MTHRTVQRWLIAGALAVGFASMAQAQATRTWVSGVGDDANPCSRTAPCKTFAGAISKTAARGEISVLDPGGFGAVTITKSITINGEGTLAGILSAGTNGIVINAAAGDTVIIRNISIVGAGTGLNGIRVLAAGALHVENVTIDGFTQRGIDVQPSTPLILTVKDTNISNCNTVSGGGILVKPTATGSVAGLLERVRLNQNTFGIRVEDRGNVTARDSDASGNLNNGWLAISGGTAAVLSLDRCTGSNNRNATNTSAGVQSNGSAALVNLANTSLFNNNLGILSVSSGQIISFGNNQNTNNGTNGAPTSTIAQQ